jgi:putative hydrolases of HD superfamily
VKKSKNKPSKNSTLKSISNFLFETGMLAKTPRSGFFFLGSGEQSVAEHINRVCYIGYVLAHLAQKDHCKVINMCLFHDIAEARVSDLNYVHQKYNERKEEKAVADLVATLPFGKHMADIIHEYEERESYESKLTKDADNLELILSLKEQVDLGNSRAKDWIKSSVQRLITKEAKKLVKVILKTESDEWWYGHRGDTWWVNRNKPDKYKVDSKK